MQITTSSRNYLVEGIQLRERKLVPNWLGRLVLWLFFHRTDTVNIVNLTGFNEREDTRMDTPIMRFFTYLHLPENLQPTAKAVAELAKTMNETLPDGAEKSAGLRKLLEAKDCFVRAQLP